MQPHALSVPYLPPRPRSAPPILLQPPPSFTPRVASAVSAGRMFPSAPYSSRPRPPVSRHASLPPNSTGIQVATRTALKRTSQRRIALERQIRGLETLLGYVDSRILREDLKRQHRQLMGELQLAVQAEAAAANFVRGGSVRPANLPSPPTFTRPLIQPRIPVSELRNFPGKVVTHHLGMVFVAASCRGGVPRSADQIMRIKDRLRRKAAELGGHANIMVGSGLASHTNSWGLGAKTWRAPTEAERRAKQQNRLLVEAENRKLKALASELNARNRDLRRARSFGSLGGGAGYGSAAYNRLREQELLRDREVAARNAERRLEAQVIRSRQNSLAQRDAALRSAQIANLGGGLGVPLAGRQRSVSFTGGVRPNLGLGGLGVGGVGVGGFRPPSPRLGGGLGVGVDPRLRRASISGATRPVVNYNTYVVPPANRGLGLSPGHHPIGLSPRSVTINNFETDHHHSPHLGGMGFHSPHLHGGGLRSAHGSPAGLGGLDDFAGYGGGGGSGLGRSPREAMIDPIIGDGLGGVHGGGLFAQRSAMMGGGYEFVMTDKNFDDTTGRQVAGELGQVEGFSGAAGIFGGASEDDLIQAATADLVTRAQALGANGVLQLDVGEDGQGGVVAREVQEPIAASPVPKEASPARELADTEMKGTPPPTTESASEAAPEASSESLAPPPPQPSEEDIEALAAKKRKAAAAADEGKKRSRRMFGLMQSTLKQSKEELSTGKLGGAAQKRRELEERLASKLSQEKQELEEKQNRERESKSLKLSVVRKEEEISTADSLYRTRHAAKLNLASFLCTSFSLPPPPPSNDGITVPFAPRLPHALRIVKPDAPKPIYYLPYRLLPSQEDQIEDQIALVKKEIRKEREAWEDAKGEKVDELEQAKRRRDEQMEEVERAEREERQKRRREQEEREEKDRASRSREPDSERRSMDVEASAEPASKPAAVESGDVAMEAEEPAAEPVGDLAAVGDEGKMDGVEGEEDLEY
ncbi:Pinin/SDK/MemA protein domain containing protein [Pseudohyphozyma bogoriensis]|nr:Pinin/SDK/MemA protein domain containing protein [Pseudohyphozyma bogoriensis]